MRVLLVEDSETARRIAEVVLTSMGCRVFGAADGDAALAMSRLRTFDLVLVDRELPGLSGVELVRELRARPGPNRFTPAFALSGTNTDEALAECRDVGMLGLIPKPLHRETLRRILSMVKRRDRVA